MTTVAGISPRTFSPALIDFDIFAVFAVLTPIFTNLMPLATSPIRGIADTIDKPASVQLPLAADIAALSKSGIAPIPGKNLQQIILIANHQELSLHLAFLYL